MTASRPPRPRESAPAVSLLHGLTGSTLRLGPDGLPVHPLWRQEMDWCLRIAHTPADTPAWLLPTQHHRRQHLWRLGPRGTETGRTLYLFERIDRDIVRGGVVRGSDYRTWLVRGRRYVVACHRPKHVPAELYDSTRDRVCLSGKTLQACGEKPTREVVRCRRGGPGGAAPV